MELNKRDIRTFSMLGQDRSFFLKLTEKAAEDNNIVILTADFGREIGLEKFRQNFPEQYFDVGIAEQNMIGVASGMAKTGLNVFATTYATFVTARCFEQIRINIGYMNFPVKLIGRMSGLYAGFLGATHYSWDDISIMRSIPNMNIVAPADALEAVKLAESAINFDKPLYIRLNDSVNIPIVYKEDYNFEIGKGVALQEGSDIAIFATGTMVAPALKAAKLLADENISAAVVNLHTIKPLDTEIIDKFSDGKKFIVTVEEHGKIGGLGSAVADYISEKNSSPKLLKIGLPDSFIKGASYDFLLNKYGLTAEKIFEKIKLQFMSTTSE